MQNNLHLPIKSSTSSKQMYIRLPKIKFKNGKFSDHANQYLCSTMSNLKMTLHISTQIKLNSYSREKNYKDFEY